MGTGEQAESIPRARGGDRPRLAKGLTVWVQGRWGRRRVRVSECSTVIRAENCYRELLFAGISVDADCEVVSAGPCGARYRATSLPNGLWRGGRIFLICDGCGRRSTRLYAPAAGHQLRCRRCWGLTYESRAVWSYHGELSRYACYATTAGKRAASMALRRRV